MRKAASVLIVFSVLAIGPPAKATDFIIGSPLTSGNLPQAAEQPTETSENRDAWQPISLAEDLTNAVVSAGELTRLKQDFEYKLDLARKQFLHYTQTSLESTRPG